MKPSAECKRLAEIPREKANEIDDAELKAKYEDLARGFLRLASQIEQDMNGGNAPSRKDRTAA